MSYENKLTKMAYQIEPKLLLVSSLKSTVQGSTHLVYSE